MFLIHCQQIQESDYFEILDLQLLEILQRGDYLISLNKIIFIFELVNEDNATRFADDPLFTILTCFMSKNFDIFRLFRILTIREPKSKLALTSSFISLLSNTLPLIGTVEISGRKSCFLCFIRECSSTKLSISFSIFLV